jgi:hypothetical protein
LCHVPDSIVDFGDESSRWWCVLRRN